MNRCPTRPCRHHRRQFWLAAAVLIGLSLGTTAVTAQELQRQFPATAQPGTLEVIAPAQILIDGRAERLSPGARIKSGNNLLVMSASLVGQRLAVQYMRDPLGLVHEVWLLTAAEAQRIPMPVITNIVFGSEATRPKTDDGKTPFNQLPTFPSQ